MNKDLARRLISNQGWFKGLADRDIEQIVDLSPIKHCPAKEFIYMLGEKRSSLYCLLDGRVKVSIVGQSGEEFVLAIWEKGVCFGESSLHQGGVMPLEARTLSDSWLLEIPHSAIDKVLGQDSIFYRNIMLDTIRRAKELYQLIEILLFSPLHARLAARILHFVSLFGEECEDGILLPMKLSQSDFAGMSGGSRQRVNQIFRNWSKNHIVTKSGKYYVIRDLQALEAQVKDKE